MSNVTNRPLFVAEEICQDSDAYNVISLAVWPLKERRARNGDAGKTRSIQQKYGKFMPATVAVTQRKNIGGGNGQSTTIYLPKDAESCEAFCAAYREAVGIEDPTANMTVEEEEDDFDTMMDGLFDEPEAIVADFLSVHANRDNDFIVGGVLGYSFREFAINSKPTVPQREALVKFMKCLDIANDPTDSRGTRARDFALNLAEEHAIKGMFKLSNAKRAKGIDVSDIPTEVAFA